jgi:hypothetical protein
MKDEEKAIMRFCQFLDKSMQKKGIYQFSFGTAISEYLNTIEAKERDFKVVTLCGSTRFKEQFLEVQKKLSLEGYIVLSVELFGHSGDEEAWQPGTKEMLDRIHLRKIDMSDGIYVINVGGYIGESTKREIEYAFMNDKYIRYLEPI